MNLLDEIKKAIEFDERAAKQAYKNKVRNFLLPLYVYWVGGAEWQSQAHQKWFGMFMKMGEALQDIANHKPDSIDKVNLILQCEGYQKRAQRGLDEARRLIESTQQPAKMVKGG